MTYKKYEFPKDVPLILSALLWMAYFEIIIRLKPLPDILSSIRNLKTSRTVSSEEAMIKLDKLWRACGFWSMRLSRNPRPCLRRSLVLYRWCKKRNVESRLFVGAGKDGKTLKGHAWISVYGTLYREDPVELGKNYVIMLEG